MKATRELLNKRFERSESVQLPKLLELYLREGRELDEQLFSMLAFWLGHLETRLYKTSKRVGDISYEMHTDRILLFLAYAAEHKHKDGALIMSSYRFIFPYADLYLKLKRRRIAIGQEGWSVTKTLTCPELKHIRVLLTIKAQLEERNVRLTRKRTLACWKEYITKTKGKAPGVIATANFMQRLEKYERAFAYLQQLERSWYSPFAGSVATE